MTMHFDGRRNHGRRVAVALNSPVTTTDGNRVGPFREYRKTMTTFAVRIDEPFTVDTLEGMHEGRPGSYLAVGAEGELYPIDAQIFESTYEVVDPSRGMAVPDEATVDVAPGESAVVQIVDPAPGQNRVVVHRSAGELGHEPDGREFTSSVCTRCGLMVAYAVRDQVVCGGVAGK